MGVSTVAASLAAILCVAGPAWSENALGVDLALAKQAVEVSGAGASTRANFEIMAKAVVGGYVAGATDAKTPIDRQALEEALHRAINDDETLWVANVVAAYEEVYTPDELRLLVSYYQSPADRRGDLPDTLAAKKSRVAVATAVGAGPLGPRLLRDIFGYYCSQAVCSEHTLDMLAKMSPPGSPLANPATTASGSRGKNR